MLKTIFMNPNRKLLLLSSVCVFPVMLVVFPVATRAFGSKWGYLLDLAVYWTYLISVMICFYKSDKGFLKNILSNPKLNYWILYSFAAFIPVLGVFFVSFLPDAGRLSLSTALLVLVSAVLNGTFEEVYWRGLYLEEFRNSVSVGLWVSTMLFTLWHFSLWFAKGVVYQGGLLALVGGAFVMGLLWSFVSRKLQNITMCIIAHVFVNVFAFTGLYVQNGF